MSRPCKNRIVSSSPEVVYFKPAGIKKKFLEEVEIKLDEYEAFRLANIDELSMALGADKMGISAPTFNRILKKSSKKIADAIINGKAIKINKK
ncbi:MAG: DUF134 domain-containing protein [Candidatus Gracilibacteria bacterium]|nr:DUF134 domain-containing protein [Candidatus Gracilibacteria bacterium]